MRRLKQLEEENTRLKRVVADLTLDKVSPQCGVFYPKGAVRLVGRERRRLQSTLGKDRIRLVLGEALADGSPQEEQAAADEFVRKSQNDR